MKSIYEISLEKHAELRGKLEVISKISLQTKQDLATYYSPGVAAPCLAIKQNPELAYTYTGKHNTIACVSDGSAVLGLGNIGGLAGLPVMEGKAMLFKHFANVDCVPIVLKTQDPDEIIRVVEAISPTFGGINLEDIKAPECFYIEEELQKRLDIPVFHDDQHGTAIVVLAGLINACKLTKRNISDIRVVIQGAGAAAIACAKLMRAYGVKNILLFDSKGPLYPGRKEGMNPYKEDIATANIEHFQGSFLEGIKGRDVFIGLGGQKNSLHADDVRTMASDPIIFALSNPDPEILPEEAKQGGAAIVATGRSDYPNQINNVLGFPGIFRGLLDARIPNIRVEHKIAAAEALAAYVTSPTPEMIVPSPFDMHVPHVVAEAIKKVGR